jgi:hypothetical protein
VTKYVTKTMIIWLSSLELFKTSIRAIYWFYTDSSFVDEFTTRCYTQGIWSKDHSNRPIINVKIINLNRQTLPLYKRLDDKNKALK